MKEEPNEMLSNRITPNGGSWYFGKKTIPYLHPLKTIRFPISNAGWLVALLFFSWFSPSAMCANSPAPSTSVMMEYHELKNAPYYANYTEWPRPFAKEPEFVSSNKVLRCLLPLGGVSNLFMGLLWIPQQNQLRLDLNRNGDLTDDPEGVFQGTNSGNWIEFSGVPVSLNNRQGRIKFLLKFSFYNQPSYRRVQVGIHSMYHGKLEINGQAYEAGFVLNPFSHLDGEISSYAGGFLLRPWDDLEKPFLLAPSWETIDFSETLFLQNHAWQLERRWEPRGDTAVIRMDWRPTTVPLGRVTVNGTLIHRVVLEKGAPSGPTHEGMLAKQNQAAPRSPLVVVIDQPGTSFSIPAAEYKKMWVAVKKGDHEAMSQDLNLTLKENETKSLSVGGPLTNAVTFTRYDGSLRLSYRLLGAGGKTYQMMRSAKEPPSFVIYHKNRQVASGQFQFG
jgi:hypothetical protein